MLRRFLLNVESWCRSHGTYAKLIFYLSPERKIQDVLPTQQTPGTNARVSETNRGPEMTRVIPTWSLPRMRKHKKSGLVLQKKSVPHVVNQWPYLSLNQLRLRRPPPKNAGTHGLQPKARVLETSTGACCQDTQLIVVRKC